MKKKNNLKKQIKKPSEKREHSLTSKKEETLQKKIFQFKSLFNKKKYISPTSQKTITKKPEEKQIPKQKKILFKLPFTKKNTSIETLHKELTTREQKKEAQQKKLVEDRENSIMKKLMIQKRKQSKAKKKVKNRQLLRSYLDKAGYEDTDESKITKNLFRIIIIVCLILTVASLILASFGKPGVKKSILFLSGIWTGVFAGLFVLAWVILYIFLDMRVFNRTLAVEEVLPDFLQLTSANISAGMPIDRALWFAVRPRFGVLAKEIEDVAKSTVSGEDLKIALLKFSGKYDSVLLKRSINLLLEGMEAGGELAGLLNKVALNIQETRIIKKEMAANVMTYAIFIGFATIVAAPVLFALSGELLNIIQGIMGMMGDTGGGGAMSVSITGNAISSLDFKIFSVLTLFITALFSASIISTIRKGNIKEGLRFIPIFILGTLILYFISSWALHYLLGGMLEM